MAAKNDIIEPLHCTIKLKLQLSRVLVADFFRRLHCAHLVHPCCHCGQTLVIGWKIRVCRQGLLHVAKSWQKVIYRLDIEGQYIDWCNELGGNVEDSLG